MRIVFMGATDLGWNCCRTLLETGQEVAGIFSIPRQFRISWSTSAVTNVQHKSFEDLASAHSLSLVYVTGKMSDPMYAEALRKMRPDIIIVAGWYYILPRSFREIATLGAVGLHASLLPKYRGGAPLVWAIINGETETGVSFFHFADGVDDGDIIAQAKLEIAFADDIAAVVQKASTASQQLIAEYVPRLAAGTAPRVVQNHDQATFVPQRKPENGVINWPKLSARQAYDWVRAQTRPYPGAFTFLGEEKVTIWKSAPAESGRIDGPATGSIVIDGGRFISVVCADGRELRINEISVAGQLTPVAEFTQSRNLETGMKFETPERTCGLVIDG